MSGFLALLSDDPRPCDLSLLADLTASMAYRGPDAQDHRALSHCGLGFALLDTTDGRHRDEQPRRLDSDLWIVADARLDDRAALAASLNDSPNESLDAQDAQRLTDSDLILRAYRRWGSACVDRLLGDFSFVIWDGAQRKLLAARDPLGMRPFYFAVQPDGLICCNTLHSLRRHPQVSDDLHDPAVADFLLFGANHDLASSIFADVQRLPPAHLMVWQPQGGPPRTRRYSQLEAQNASVPKRFEEAAEEYRHLLHRAVEDRLTSDHNAIFLSGGMDSPAVAALAWHVLQGRPRPTRFEAYTAVYRRLLNDPEEPYARAVSEHLGMPHRVQAVDDYRFFEGWGQRFLSAEPADGNMLPLNSDLYRQVTSYSRVAFTGDGADPALILPADDLWCQLKSGRLDRVGSYLWQALRTGQRPPLGIRTAWLRWRQQRRWKETFPSWLRGDWVERLQLQDRWREVRFGAKKDHRQERGEAMASLVDPLWVAVFESEDPGSSGFLLERRHPFFDLRLLRFSLALPSPWCQGKRLLRQAVADILPAVVVQRPKTPLAGIPRHTFAVPPRQLVADLQVANPRLMEYLDISAIYRDLDPIEGTILQAKAQSEAADGAPDCDNDGQLGQTVALDEVSMRAFSLAFWLGGLEEDGKGSDLCS